MNKATEVLIINRIKDLIIKKKTTSYQISKNSGMNPSTLNNLLNGKFTDARFSTIEKICEGLGISVKEFFNDSIFK